MRFTHIDVNFDVKYEGHQNCSKTLSMHILRVFGQHHMWHRNWHQYVWTSLCQFIFFVNLLHSPCVWLFDIFLTAWHLFDNLTSFLTYRQQDWFQHWFHEPVPMSLYGTCPISLLSVGLSLRFFLLKISLISTYKMPPCLPCYLIRALSNLSIKIRSDGIFVIPTLVPWTCSNVLVLNLANISVITWTFS